MEDTVEYGLNPVVYDPSKLHVFVGGERVAGFPSSQKMKIRRGTCGVFEMELFLLGTSPWVPKLRVALGHETSISVQYPGYLADHLAFEAEGYLAGVDMLYTDGVPVFSFYFKNKD